MRNRIILFLFIIAAALSSCSDDDKEEIIVENRLSYTKWASENLTLVFYDDLVALQGAKSGKLRFIFSYTLNENIVLARGIGNASNGAETSFSAVIRKMPNGDEFMEIVEFYASTLSISSSNFYEIK